MQNDFVQFELSAAEIVFLAQRYGKGSWLGVSDPLDGISKAEKASIFAEIEEDLIQKKMCRPAFGGKLIFCPEMQSLIEICMECEYHLRVERKKRENDLVIERYYSLGGQWASLLAGEHGLILSHTSKEQIQEVVKSLPVAKNIPTAEYAIEVTKRKVNEIMRLVQLGKLGEVREILKNIGCEKADQELFLAAITGEADAISLKLRSKVEGKYVPQDAFLAVLDGNVWEWYQTVDEDDRTVLGLRPGADGEYSELRKVAEQWSVM